MPEENGSEQNARMTRMEREHEQFRRDLRDLLTAQVIQKTQIDDMLIAINKHTEQFESEEKARRENDKILDQRVADLVSAIGDLIRRIPPENLKPIA